MIQEETAVAKVGRPTVLNITNVAKLEAALQRGMSISTACQQAQVGRKAFYERYNKDEEFRNRMDSAKEYAKALAGNILMDVLQDANRDEVLKGKDGEILVNKYGQPIYAFKYSPSLRVETAKWWLEKKERSEFGPDKGELNGGDTYNNQINVYNITDDRLKEIAAATRLETLGAGELIEALEVTDMGRGNPEEATVVVREEELQRNDTANESMPQS